MDLAMLSLASREAHVKLMRLVTLLSLETPMQQQHRECTSFMYFPNYKSINKNIDVSLALLLLQGVVGFLLSI